jgi:hypothetical protein
LLGDHGGRGGLRARDAMRGENERKIIWKTILLAVHRSPFNAA